MNSIQKRDVWLLKKVVQVESYCLESISARSSRSNSRFLSLFLFRLLLCRINLFNFFFFLCLRLVGWTSSHFNFFFFILPRRFRSFCLLNRFGSFIWFCGLFFNCFVLRRILCIFAGLGSSRLFRLFRLRLLLLDLKIEYKFSALARLLCLFIWSLLFWDDLLDRNFDLLLFLFRRNYFLVFWNFWGTSFLGIWFLWVCFNFFALFYFFSRPFTSLLSLGLFFQLSLDIHFLIFLFNELLLLRLLRVLAPNIFHLDCLHNAQLLLIIVLNLLLFYRQIVNLGQLRSLHFHIVRRFLAFLNLNRLIHFVFWAVLVYTFFLWHHHFFLFLLTITHWLLYFTLLLWECKFFLAWLKAQIVLLETWVFLEASESLI